MKTHKEWLNETLDNETSKKFELETANVTTIDEIILTISGAAWRGALEEVLAERKAQGDNHLKCVFDLIEQELGIE